MVETSTNLPINAGEIHLKHEGTPPHWIIEEPNGATSRGTCKHCCVIKEFPNFVAKGSFDLKQPKPISEKSHEFRRRGKQAPVDTAIDGDVNSLEEIKFNG